jgi:hypothetical protein
MVGAHRVRPKCPIDISTKLRCTQIIPILLPSTQKLEEPSISPMIKLTGSDSDNFMKITVDIPDEIAQRLGQTHPSITFSVRNSCLFKADGSLSEL